MQKKAKKKVQQIWPKKKWSNFGKNGVSFRLNWFSCRFCLANRWGPVYPINFLKFWWEFQMTYKIGTKFEKKLKFQVKNRRKDFIGKVGLIESEKKIWLKKTCFWVNIMEKIRPENWVARIDFATNDSCSSFCGKKLQNLSFLTRNINF